MQSPSNAELIEAIKSDNVLYSKVGNGALEIEHLDGIKKILGNDVEKSQLIWQQNGNILESSLTLENGVKVLIQKDSFNNIYLQSNIKKHISTYDEAMAQESLEKLAKDELEQKVAKNISNYEPKIDRNRQKEKDQVLTKEAQNPKQNKEVPHKEFSYSTDGIKPIKQLRADLKQALEPIVNKEIVNKQDGRVAYIPSKNINKISSKKAVQKSVDNGFSKEEHIKTAQYLQELYENAKFIKSQNDRSGAENLIIHRYEKMIKINNKEAKY